ncbi:MAG: hypothetical protein M3619_29655 [Myxococcota bacterium]|nr:hypothetical protein [Myxococcota bacterium]
MIAHGRSLARRAMAVLEDLRHLHVTAPEDAERIRAAIQAELIALTDRESLTEKAGR